MDTSSRLYKLLLCCLAFITMAGVYFFYIKADESTYLNIDEVDYVLAAHKGLIANYFERGSLSAKNFVSFCLAKKKKDTAALKKLSQNYNEEADVHLLRHLHPSLPVYYWTFFRNKNPFTETIHLHWSNFPVILICFLLTLLIVFRVYKPSLTGLLLVLLLILPLLISPFLLHSFGQINFHNFELLFAIVFCGALIQYSLNSTPARLMILALAMAALLCTLDMSLIAILPCVLLSLLLQKGLFCKQSWLTLIKFSLLTLLFVFVMWAGGIIKIALFKSLFNFFYRIFLHADDEFNKLSAAAAWSAIIKGNLIAFSIFTPFLVLFIVRIKNTSWHCRTLVFTGFVYCLAFTPFFVSGNYMVPGLYMMTFGFICMLLEIKLQFIYRLNSLNILLVIVLAIATFFSFKEIHLKEKKEHFINKEVQLGADYAFMKQHLKSDSVYYAYDYRVINYYCHLHTHRLATFSTVKPGLYKREYLIYKSLVPDIVQHKVNGLIAFKSIHFSNKVMDFIKSESFKKYTLNTYIVMLRQK